MRAVRNGDQEEVARLLEVGAWSKHMGDELKEVFEHNRKLIVQQAEAIRNGCDEAAADHFPGYFPRDLSTLVEKFIDIPFTKESVDKSLDYIQFLGL